MSTYKDLIVWQRAMELVERIDAFTATLPNDERFGLCMQLQRAAVSIPSNTAEGQSRKRLGLERSSRRRLLYSIFLALAPACWYLLGTR